MHKNKIKPLLLLLSTAGMLQINWLFTRLQEQKVKDSTLCLQHQEPPIFLLNYEAAFRNKIQKEPLLFFTAADTVGGKEWKRLY